MKLTKEQLQRIIKEELGKVITESDASEEEAIAYAQSAEGKAIVQKAMKDSPEFANLIDGLQSGEISEGTFSPGLSDDAEIKTGAQAILGGFAATGVLMKMLAPLGAGAVALGMFSAPVIMLALGVYLTNKRQKKDRADRQAWHDRYNPDGHNLDAADRKAVQAAGGFKQWAASQPWAK